jgi:hypothetical protein
MYFNFTHAVAGFFQAKLCRIVFNVCYAINPLLTIGSSIYFGYFLGSVLYELYVEIQTTEESIDIGSTLFGWVIALCL